LQTEINRITEQMTNNSRLRVRIPTADQILRSTLQTVRNSFNIYAGSCVVLAL